MVLLALRYLSDAELDQLKNYKYASGLYGFIDRIVMTPFWNRLVFLLPLNMAPNLVTLIALLVMASGTCLIGYFAPTLTEPIPSWALYYASACIFVYQTLDAIDGKQARRTGSSSPLGQLFDHGCDSISVTLMCLVMSAMVSLGGNWMLMAVFYLFVVPFYGANWEECQTGTMRFASISVTEVQHAMIAMLVFTGYYGTEQWSMLLFGYPLKLYLVCFFSVGVAKGFLENLCFGLRAKNPSPHIHLQLLQFFAFLVLAPLWTLAPNHQLIAHHPYLCIAGCGCVFSYLINRLIIAHVTHGSYNGFYPIMWPMPFLVANVLMQEPLIDPLFASQIFVGYVGFMYAHFVISVIDEICQHLGIRPFVISVKSE